MRIPVFASEPLPNSANRRDDDRSDDALALRGVVAHGFPKKRTPPAGSAHLPHAAGGVSVCVCPPDAQCRAALLCPIIRTGGKQRTGVYLDCHRQVAEVRCGPSRNSRAKPRGRDKRGLPEAYGEHGASMTRRKARVFALIVAVSAHTAADHAMDGSEVKPVWPD